MKLVLVSRSPQRRAILGQLGVPFEVRPSGAEERSEGEPEAVAVENAVRKVTAVAGAPGEVLLGVDTVVALDGRIFGKPGDAAEAARFLAALSDRTHVVVSGLAVSAGGGPVRTAAAATQVTFRALDARWIDWYVGTGEWRERAGGYAIQGCGAALVCEIHGDYLNVVGLPVAALLDLLPDLLAAGGRGAA